MFLKQLFATLIIFASIYLVTNAENQNKIITTTHRFQAGVSYGGWGPHLGHLLRDTSGVLWFADDTGNDVNKNPGINYYKFLNGTWSLAGTNTFFGLIQQNTGSLMMNNDLIFTYGVDTSGHRIEECYFSTKTVYKGCNSLPFVLDAQANYIGAALSPNGTKIVWWTDVRDNSAGKFHYIYNFGSGWNGPVSAVLPGFSAVSYINIAFKDNNSFTLLGQLDSGLAPNWKYIAGVYDGVIGQQSAWATLAGTGDNAAYSTSDIWIDPITKNGHLLVRNVGGGISYYHRPANGSWSNILFSIPNVFRGRFVNSSNGKLYVVYGPTDSGLRYYEVEKSSLSGTINFSALASKQIDISSDYANIDAIYPESSIYQQTLVKDLNFAVNGRLKQGEITHIFIPTPIPPASVPPDTSPTSTPPTNPTATTTPPVATSTPSTAPPVEYSSPATPTALLPFEFLHLKFDDSLIDISSKNNDGASSNSPLFIEGKYGKAALFNGSTNSVQITDNDSLKPGEVSLSAWIRIDTLPFGSNVAYLVGKPHATDWQSYAVQLTSSGKIIFSVQNKDLNQWPRWETKASLATGVWYHIGTTYKKKGNDSLDGAIYINGNQTETTFGGTPATSAFTMKYDATAFDIGRFSPKNDRYYKGAIDDVRAYSKAINACEMQTIAGVNN